MNKEALPFYWVCWIWRRCIWGDCTCAQHTLRR